MSYLCSAIKNEHITHTTMETKNTNNIKSSWDEYWRNRLAEYYSTARYTGD